jgi:hypothetical protein
VPAVRRDARLLSGSSFDGQAGNGHRRYALEHGGPVRRRRPLSGETFQLLSRADGLQSVRSLAASLDIGSAAQDSIQDELRQLWEERMITMRPLEKHEASFSNVRTASVTRQPSRDAEAAQ